MPLYEYECQVCLSRQSRQRSIAERNRGPYCCDLMMEKRIFTPTMAEFPEWDVNYRCVATGQEVTSQRQRKQIMAKHDLADARDFDIAPDPERMAQEVAEVHASAKQEIPADLRDAMQREGHADLL